MTARPPAKHQVKLALGLIEQGHTTVGIVRAFAAAAAGISPTISARAQRDAQAVVDEAARQADVVKADCPCVLCSMADREAASDAAEQIIRFAAGI